MNDRIELGRERLAPSRCETYRSAVPGSSVRAGSTFLLSSVIAISFTFISSLALIAQTKTASEYEIKAAFLLNFAKFVEWPPSVFPDSKHPFNICVLGTDPFGRLLDDAVLGKAIANHPVSLARARQIQELPDCQVLFIARSQRSPLSEILGEFRGKNVLIVGETEDFASSGGAIQFLLEGHHVRFAINPDAAERAGLKISSKLLALAVVVRDSQRHAEEKR